MTWMRRIRNILGDETGDSTTWSRFSPVLAGDHPAHMKLDYAELLHETKVRRGISATVRWQEISKQPPPLRGNSLDLTSEAG